MSQNPNLDKFTVYTRSEEVDLVLDVETSKIGVLLSPKAICDYIKLLENYIRWTHHEIDNQQEDSKSDNKDYIPFIDALPLLNAIDNLKVLKILAEKRIQLCGKISNKSKN